MATPDPAAPTTPGAVAHQLLLVEDEPETAQFLKSELESRGFKVLTARDGGQAHSMFAMRKPDFVILDLILPGASGFEICEHMKQTDETVPVLILSVIDMEDARRLAARVGADGYLVKPVPPDLLAEKIRETAEIVWQRYHAEQPRHPGRIRFSCRCGKRFKVSASHRGKTLTCPECGEPVLVPRHD